MQVQRAIGEWGEACGRQPGAAGNAGGVATVVQKGTELTISGVGPTYSTTACWEKHPGLSRESHSGGSRAWASVCRTGEDSDRNVEFRTSISATDRSIHFDETGQYQFRVGDQACTASTRRTQDFTLIEGVAGEPRRTADSDCTTTGEPTRLEVAPEGSVARVGDQLQLSGKLKDAEGCSLALPISWRVVPPVDGVSVGDDGLVTIGSEASEGDVTIAATGGGMTRQTELQIVSAESYDALLGGWAESATTPKPPGAPPAGTTTAALSGGEAVAEDRATARKYWFVAIVGALAAALGVLGLMILRQGRKMAAPLRPAPARRPNTPVARKICPTCGSIYETGAEFCGKDGSSLVQAN
jgi:hypothetical protein